MRSKCWTGKTLTTDVAAGVGIENWALGVGLFDMSLSRDDVDVYSRDFTRTSQMNTNLWMFVIAISRYGMMRRCH